MPFPKVAGAFALIGAIASWPLAAQETLTEKAAVERALLRGGIAARDEAEREAARAEIATIGPLDHPSLEVSRESAGSENEWQLQAVQPLDLFGRRGPLREAARSEAMAIDADIARRRQQLIADVRNAYASCAAAGAELTIYEGLVTRLAEAERVAGARAAAGDTATYDLRRVRVEARSAETQRDIARGDQNAACTGLSTLTGISAPIFPTDAIRALANGAATGERPELTALEQRMQAAGQRAEAARRARFPELALGAGLKRVSDGQSAEFGPIVSVGVTLPIFNGGSAAVAAADARERAIEAEYLIALRTIEAEQAVAAARLTTSRAAAASGARALDDASRLGNIAETAYQAGEVGVVELLDAYQAAADAELSSIALARRAAEAAIQFDLATGRSFP